MPFQYMMDDSSSKPSLF